MEIRGGSDPTLQPQEDGGTWTSLWTIFPWFQPGFDKILPGFSQHWKIKKLCDSKRISLPQKLRFLTWSMVRFLASSVVWLARKIWFAFTILILYQLIYFIIHKFVLDVGSWQLNVSTWGTCRLVLEGGSEEDRRGEVALSSTFRVVETCQHLWADEPKGFKIWWCYGNRCCVAISLGELHWLNQDFTQGIPHTARTIAPGTWILASWGLARETNNWMDWP